MAQRVVTLQGNSEAYIKELFIACSCSVVRTYRGTCIAGAPYDMVKISFIKPLCNIFVRSPQCQRFVTVTGRTFPLSFPKQVSVTQRALQFLGNMTSGCVVLGKENLCGGIATPRN